MPIHPDYWTPKPTAAGQLDHPTASNAPGNETAGTWVRVAEPAAGARFNQWVIDDTPQQLRQSLSSSYAASQLNIGCLIRQDGNTRGAFRGTGFELATDAWATLRAKRGISITTIQRHGATSTQLDAQEAQQKLKQAADLAKTLSDASTHHLAVPLTIQDGLQQLLKTIDSKESFDGHDAPKFEQPVALFAHEGGAKVIAAKEAVSIGMEPFIWHRHLWISYQINNKELHAFPTSIYILPAAGSRISPAEQDA